MTNVRSRLIADGATGYVGANFVAHLARHRPDLEIVTLSRGGPERVRRAIGGAVVGGSEGQPAIEAVRCLDYELERPGLGLEPVELEELFDRPCDYWHFAARVDLSPMGLGELLATNVEGTRNTLDVFCAHARPGSRYFMIGTAYSCGHTDHVVDEQWHPQAPLSAFRTHYEATKRAAEHLVAEAMRERGLDGAVLRLGQVVGDSVSGRTTTGYGLYDFLRTMRRLAERRPGEEVRLEAADDATLDLVPIDRCVAWLLAVADRSDAGADPPIYHVVDRRPVPVTSVAAAIADHLPVRIVPTPPERMGDRDLTLLERLLAARMTYTGRYITRRIRFSRRHLEQVVGDTGVAVTDEVLDRLVGTFLKNEAEPSLTGSERHG